MINPAVQLARMRRGIKEKKSEGKRRAACANLEAARAKWSAMTPDERKRTANSPADPSVNLMPAK